jgi:hypothetical protein
MGQGELRAAGAIEETGNRGATIPVGTGSRENAARSTMTAPVVRSVMSDPRDVNRVDTARYRGAVVQIE